MICEFSRKIMRGTECPGCWQFGVCWSEVKVNQMIGAHTNKHALTGRGGRPERGRPQSSRSSVYSPGPKNPGVMWTSETMKKQYVLSAEEYENLVPKSELENLQKIIDRTTEVCVEVAFKRGNCIKGGKRRYCVHYPRNDTQLNCSFWKMCQSEMKRYEDAPRELDHMIE